MIMCGRIVLEGDDVCGWLLGIGRRHGYYDVWRGRASCKRFWISWCHCELRERRETEGERERGERRVIGFATRVKRDHPAAPVFERF